MKLYKHQQEIIDKNLKRTGLFLGTGTGKTVIAIMLANNNINSCLVICPKSVKENWEREISKWGKTKFEVITKETFRRDWKKIKEHRGIIWDECHFTANYRSQIYKATLQYIQKCQLEYVWLLTATPYLSTPWNIYSLANLLGHNWKWHKFKDWFFYEIKMGVRSIPVVKKTIDGVPIEKFIGKLVNKIGITLQLDECVDMPPEIDKIEYFDPTKEQLKMIDMIDEFLPIVRYSKIHQILNGTLKSDGYTENQMFSCPKLQRAIELTKEYKKLAIVCRHRLEIKNLASKLKKRKVFTLTGDTKDRQAVIDKIEKTDDCVVLISAGVSEGYNLPSVKFMVFYSLSYSWKDYLQLRGRIRRINKPQRVVYLHLLVKDTVDEAVYDNIKRKQNFDIEIYDKKI